jgi:hypothetical protein
MLGNGACQSVSQSATYKHGDDVNFEVMFNKFNVYRSIFTQHVPRKTEIAQ